MGSKNKIAEWVLSNLPPAKRFYDIFCGGCAVTHAAMLSGRYQEFYINDIQPEIPRLFYDAVGGDLPEDYLAPIDREQFFARKNEPLIRLCWSFGNRGATYLWGKDVEEQKLEAYKMVTSDSVEKRYSHFQKFIKTLQASVPTYSESESLNRVLTIERLQALQALQALLRVSGVDYQNIEILPDSVVYADPPYRGTYGYNEGGFDFDRFDDWLRSTPFPVYVSEYTMPDDFVCIAETEKAVLFDQGNSGKAIEKIFLHERFASSVQVQATFDF